MKRRESRERSEAEVLEFIRQLIKQASSSSSSPSSSPSSSSPSSSSSSSTASPTSTSSSTSSSPSASTISSSLPSSVINRRSSSGLTLLHAASLSNHQQVLRLLFSQAELELDANYQDRWTALMLASRSRNVECVKLLVAQGADPSPLFQQQQKKKKSNSFSSSSSSSSSASPPMCLHFDQASKAAILAAARAGYEEYKVSLRRLMSSSCCPLPLELCDIVADYVCVCLHET